MQVSFLFVIKVYNVSVNKIKMPPQKPVGNGYYGYEEIPNSNSPQVVLENSIEDSVNNTPSDPSSPNEEDNDFEEYLWMENEEEFDKQVLQQLEEEELMEQCLEAMLEDEEEKLMAERMLNNMHCPGGPQSPDVLELVNSFKLDLVDVEKSTLNPLAAEFVPNRNTTRCFNSTNME